MRRHIGALALIVLLGVTGSSWASEFAANFDAYAPGLGVHGRDGWKGWDNVAATDAVVSNLHARSGQNSLRVLSNTDIVHEFKLAGGKWVISAMQYIPSSGATGIAYFILLNTYRDGGPYDWSAQTQYNMTTGTITPWHGATGSNTTISYDRWVEIKFVIDLTANTFEEYYNSVKIAAGEWDDDTNGTLQAIDLFGNGSSSVYYDDIKIDSGTVSGSSSCFPRPAYDSGWVSVSPGHDVNLKHNLGGNTDNYVIDMQSKSILGISNQGYGMDGYYAAKKVGYYYHGLKSTSVWIGWGKDDTLGDLLRIRIWVYDCDTTDPGPVDPGPGPK